MKFARDAGTEKTIAEMAGLKFGESNALRSSRDDDRVALYQQVYTSALMGAATLLDGPDAEVANQARKLCRRAAILASTAIDDDEMMWAGAASSHGRFIGSDSLGNVYGLDAVQELCMKRDQDEDRLEGGQRRHEQQSQPIGKPLTSEPIGKPPESKPLHKEPEGEPFKK